MNIAFDLIEREHEAVAECIARFEDKPHRSTVLELCALVERHEQMEAEVLHPMLGAAGDAAATEEQQHREITTLVEQLQGTSDKRELKQGTDDLIARWRTHVDHEEQSLLPAMEDALGVARMNKLGMALLDWQHAAERADRERDEDLEELLALSRAELYEKAQLADITGRSSMKKEELAEALAEN